MKTEEEKIKNEHNRIRIGQRVAQLRRSKGLSQNELADRAKLDRTHVVKIEQGRYNFRLDTLQALAEALGCTIDFVELS